MAKTFDFTDMSGHDVVLSVAKSVHWLGAMLLVVLRDPGTSHRHPYPDRSGRASERTRHEKGRFEMAGVIIPLWNKKSWNFNNLTAGTSESHVAVKALSSERYTEALLVVRAHTRDIVNASSMIEIVAFTTAPSAEDPSVDYVSTTASGTATVADGSTSVLATAALADFGGFLRIHVIGTRISSGNCEAELSADLVCKE